MLDNDFRVEVEIGKMRFRYQGGRIAWITFEAYVWTKKGKKEDILTGFVLKRCCCGHWKMEAPPVRVNTDQGVTRVPMWINPYIFNAIEQAAIASARLGERR